MVTLYKVEYKKLREPQRGWRVLENSWTSVSAADAHIRRNFWCGDYSDLVFRIVEHCWMEREQYKFRCAIYEAVPWASEQFWQDWDVHHLHFPHRSLEDNSMLAFTMSPEHGEMDRQTRIKPGKYLTRVFITDREKAGLDPILTPKQVAFYAEWFATGTRPPVDIGDFELKFAKTPDEIAEAYREGPHSCMDGRHFPDPSTSPVRVYGAGDLAVAYLCGASKKVLARALCWPEKKAVGRVYPTPENWSSDGFESYDVSRAHQTALLHKLKELGYTHVSEGGDVLRGARLLKIRQGGSYRMPYLDNDYGVDDGGEYWIMARGGEYQCLNTHGYMDEDAADEDSISCNRCDAECDEDDTRIVYTAVSVYGAGRSPETWCSYCQDMHSFYCEGIEDYVSNDVENITIGDHTYSMAYAEHAGYYFCDRTDEYFFVEDEPPVHMENGETWCPDAFAEDGFKCAWDDSCWSNEDMSWKWPGFPADYDDDPRISFADRIAHSHVNACNWQFDLPEYKKSINDYRDDVAPWTWPGRGLASIRTVTAYSVAQDRYVSNVVATGTAMHVAIDLARSGLRYNTVCIMAAE